MKATFLLVLFTFAQTGGGLTHPLTSTPPSRCLRLTEKKEQEINMVVDRLTQLLSELEDEIDDIALRIINLEIDEYIEDDDDEKEVILQLTVNNCPRIPPKEQNITESGAGNGTCTTGQCNPGTESKGQSAGGKSNDEEQQSLEATSETDDKHSLETSNEKDEGLDIDARTSKSDAANTNQSGESEEVIKTLHCDKSADSVPAKPDSDSETTCQYSKPNEETENTQSSDLEKEHDNSKEGNESKVRCTNDSNPIVNKTDSSSAPDDSSTQCDPATESSTESQQSNSHPETETQEEHSDNTDIANGDSSNSGTENQESDTQTQDSNSNFTHALEANDALNKPESQPLKERHKIEIDIEEDDDASTVQPELMYLYFVGEQRNNIINKGRPLLVYVQKMGGQRVFVNFLN